MCFFACLSFADKRRFRSKQHGWKCGKSDERIWRWRCAIGTARDEEGTTLSLKREQRKLLLDSQSGPRVHIGRGHELSIMFNHRLWPRALSTFNLIGVTLVLIAVLDCHKVSADLNSEFVKGKSEFFFWQKIIEQWYYFFVQKSFAVIHFHVKFFKFFVIQENKCNIWSVNMALFMGNN